jgi:hypothetical protein
MSDDHNHDDTNDSGTPFPPPHDPEWTPPPAPEQTAPVAEHLPPWEDREHFGRLSGFFETIQQAMLAPKRLFSGMPISRGIWEPLTFYVVLYVLMMIVERLWSAALSGFDIALLSWLDELNGDSATNLALTHFMETMGVFFSPFIAVASLFLSAGVTHIACMLLIPGQRGFEASYRVVAYSGAAMILGVVPVCGEFLSVFWMLFIYIVALREVHETTTGRAIVVATLPIVFMFCTCLTIATLVGIIGAAS